jgi:hypothetical protein
MIKQVRCLIDGLLKGGSMFHKVCAYLRLDSSNQSHRLEGSPGRSWQGNA